MYAELTPELMRFVAQGILEFTSQTLVQLSSRDQLSVRPSSQA
jgi:hypothetical protein